MNLALITSMVMALAAIMIGGLLKYVVWTGRTPQSMVEHGRAWLAYAVFVLPMLLLHLLTPPEAGQMLVGVAAGMVAVCLLAFAAGCLRGFLKNRQPDVLSSDMDAGYLPSNITDAGHPPSEIADAGHPPSSITDAAYAEALTELEKANPVRSTWARALVKSDGDVARAKSIYIQDRVTEIAGSSTAPSTPKNLQYEDLTRRRWSSIWTGVMGLIAVVLMAAGAAYWFVQRDKTIQFSQDARMLSEQAIGSQPAPVEQPLSQSSSASQAVSAVFAKPVASEPPAAPTQTPAPQPTPAAQPTPVTTPGTPSAPTKSQKLLGSFLIGEWRCVDDEDVIDRFDTNGIYRRSWVSQRIDLLYKWHLLKEGTTTVLQRTDIEGTPASKLKLQVHSVSSDQFELVYPSGKTEKCKPFKAKPRVEPAKADTPQPPVVKPQPPVVKPEPAAADPVLKALIGKWQIGPWRFNYMANGIGEISQNGDAVCADFSYALKDNTLTVSNFSGACKQAGGVTKMSCAVDMKGRSMTLKCENGHTTEWNKIAP